MLLSHQELEEERKKRESLEKREAEIKKRLELISFRLSVLLRIGNKVHLEYNRKEMDKKLKEEETIGKETLYLMARFATQQSLIRYECMVLDEMKDELNNELKETEEKIKNCRVDFEGQEKTVRL